jgi:hypothetical protein
MAAHLLLVAVVIVAVPLPVGPIGPCGDHAPPTAATEFGTSPYTSPRPRFGQVPVDVVEKNFMLLFSSVAANMKMPALAEVVVIEKAVTFGPATWLLLL